MLGDGLDVAGGGERAADAHQLEHIAAARRGFLENRFARPRRKGLGDFLGDGGEGLGNGAAVGEGVALYACTDYIADRRAKLPERPLSPNAELLRGFAAGYLAAGADGVCTFNFFCARESNWGQPLEPSFATLGEMGRLDACRAAPRRHVLSAGVTTAETDGPVQVPVSLADRQTRAFAMLLAAPPQGARATVEVALEGQPAAADLWLHVNSLPAGPALSVSPLPAAPVKDPAAEAAAPISIATFTVPPQSLGDGKNILSLRNEGPAVTVLGLDVCIGSGQGSGQTRGLVRE